MFEINANTEGKWLYQSSKMSIGFGAFLFADMETDIVRTYLDIVRTHSDMSGRREDRTWNTVNF